ncbi:HAD family hydrolase [Streptomyces iconiensis]|uniref:HAD family hydrolase n=1 Tax=Streptomyces iconiensis TaxID=1384038 RepID=A0ABT6ZX25_9ACTN|nr:HAD family hydrolase [Streptomyces iconiensis]MDJ1133622.1 HAD family hydrolase [Streptomyces iconiensis]
MTAGRTAGSPAAGSPAARVRPVEAVLLDAGGVLIMPAPARSLPVLNRYGADPAAGLLHRAHFLATAATDAFPERDRMRYMRTYVRACGVPGARVEAAAAELGEVFDGHNFAIPSPLATPAVLGAMGALPVTHAVVSNSIGLVAEQLREAKVCQKGPGPGLPVAFIIDSALVGVAKPDPGIFALALDRLGIAAEQAVYVGDTARIDVDGAHAAGVRPLHLDPYGDCPDPPGRHGHLDSLEALVAWVRHDHER